MNDEEIAQNLLKWLRDGEIWDIKESEARNWLGAAQRVWSKDQVLSMRIRSLVAELADRRGWWDNIEPEALIELDPIKREFFGRDELLHSSPGEERETFKWFRQAGWLILQDVRREHRLQGARSSPESKMQAARQALTSARALRDQLRRILPESAAHELLYRVAFSIARHLQVLQLYGDAEKELVEALRHCHGHRCEVRRRLEVVEESLRTSKVAKEVDESKKRTLTLLESFTVSNTTVVAANLGRIDVERGRLFQAIPQLLIARTLLLDSHDIVMRGFVDLQLGSVYRQLGIEDTTGEDVANSPEKLLKSALIQFLRAKHRPLEARARIELTQYYFGAASGNPALLKKARRRLHPRHFAKQAMGETWDAHRSLLLARIEFAEQTPQSSEAAIKNATKALELAEESGLKEVEALAHLVLAETAIKNQEYEEAVKHCQRVEGLDVKDIADRGWMYLVFTDAWLKAGSPWRAERYLDEWGKIDEKVQNKRIRAKAAEVVRLYEEEVKSGFYISPRSEDIDVPRRIEELKEFLMKRAQSGNATVEEQAMRLGVQPQTLANWRSQIKRSIERGGSAKFRKVGQHTWSRRPRTS